MIYEWDTRKASNNQVNSAATAREPTRSIDRSHMQDCRTISSAKARARGTYIPSVMSFRELIYDVPGTVLHVLSYFISPIRVLQYISCMVARRSKAEVKSEPTSPLSENMKNACSRLLQPVRA